MPKGKGYKVIEYKGKGIIKYTLPKLHYTIVGYSGKQYPTLASAKAAVNKLVERQTRGKGAGRGRHFPKRKTRRR